MLKKSTLLTTPPLVLRPPVAVGRGVVVVPWESAMLTGGEGEEESPELAGVVDGGGGIEEALKVEVGGEVEVTEGRTGMEVGLFKQTSDEPGLTVMTGVALPSPLESPSMITTFVPAGVVTIGQVYEVPLTSVKAAAMGPSALPVWKD